MSEHGITNIGVIGAGQMGGGIAQVGAASGFPVVVYDQQAESIEKCRALHDKLLARAVEKERMTESEAQDAKERLTYATDLTALSETDIIIEAIVEDSEVKKTLFSHLAPNFTGNQIFASNTSSISITDLATSVGDASDRFIGMHFFNPVPVMKLVEVIKGLATSDETTDRVLALARAMGKTAVPAHDRAGFVSNRILMPMINEAFYTWMEGVAEPEHIDEIMKLGMAHPMGPLRLADFIGLDTCASIMEVMAEGLSDPRYLPCPLLKQLVTAGRLGDKTGRGVYDHAQK